MAPPTSTAAAAATLKTRILIISDTHGHRPYPEDVTPSRPAPGFSYSSYSASPAVSTTEPLRHHGFRYPLPSADVAIHCGDLTTHSAPQEYEATFALLRAIDAPLKLVIAGNHDLVMDSGFWNTYMVEKVLPQQQQQGVQRPEDLPWPAQVAAIVDAAQAGSTRNAGIHVLLRQGSHAFALANGARLRVFTSPWTPAYGGWAFQYQVRHHAFGIPPGVDVAVTHGPPHGILDRTLPRGELAGCPVLLAETARARPRLHCFGHIHEAWGAKLVTWRDDVVPGEAGSGSPQQQQQQEEEEKPVAVVDEEKSVLLEELYNLEPRLHDDVHTRTDKTLRYNQLAEGRCYPVSVCAGDEHELEYGKQTLFLNAAIMDLRSGPSHLPWLVDLDLPRASEDDDTAWAAAAAAAAPPPSATIQDPKVDIESILL